MEGRLASGGGLRIKGLIEEYKVAAGENISAGNFVSFVNDNFGEIKQLSGSTAGIIKAIQISENKVLVAYDYNSPGKVVVISVNHKDITFNTPLIIGTSGYNMRSSNMIKLSNNKVLILHTGDNYRLMSRILQINTDNTITILKSVQLIDDAYSGEWISSVLISENKIFVTHGRLATSYIQASIITVDDNSISISNTTQISTIKIGNSIISLKMGNNKIITVRNVNNSNYLYAIICTINENGTITLNKEVQLKNISCSNLNVNNLGNADIIIGYNNSVLICSLNNDTLSIISDNSIFEDTEKLPNLINSKIVFLNNKLFSLFSHTDKKYLYCIISKIENYKIIREKMIAIDRTDNIAFGGSMYCLTLSNNKVLGLFSGTTGYRLSAFVYEESEKIKQFTNSADIILGVAKQRGTENQIIKVYVPSLEGVN